MRKNIFEIEVMIDNEENRAFVSDPSTLWTEEVFKTICEKGIEENVFEMCGYAIHDKDKYNRDESETKRKGTSKKVHGHLYAKLPEGKTANPSEIQDKVEKLVAGLEGVVVDRNRIEFSKLDGKCRMSDRGKFAHMIAYLIHAFKKGAGRPDHPQNYKGQEWDGYTWLYEESEAHIYGTTLEIELEMARELDKKESIKKSGEAILEKVGAGEIRQFEIVDHVTPAVYRKIHRDLPAMYELGYMTKMKNPESKKVIFVQGTAGSGKTSWAKEYAKQLGYSVYVTASGKHPFDEYMGQDCIILDDARDGDFKPTELLKLLDNDTPCTIEARYHNKNLAFCKLLIITSVKPLKMWYSKAFEKEGEDKTQLYRRIETIVDITKDKIVLWSYDKKKGDYEFYKAMKNVFKPREEKSKLTKTIAKVCKKMKNFCQEFKSKMEELKARVEINTSPGVNTTIVNIGGKEMLSCTGSAGDFRLIDEGQLPF